MSVTNTCDIGDKDIKRKGACGTTVGTDKIRLTSSEEIKTRQNEPTRVIEGGVATTSSSRDVSHTTGTCIVRAGVLVDSPSYSNVRSIDADGGDTFNVQCIDQKKPTRVSPHFVYIRIYKYNTYSKIE